MSPGRKRKQRCSNPRGIKKTKNVVNNFDDNSKNQNGSKIHEEDNSSELVYYCNECNKPFKSLTTLQGHLECSHFPSNNNDRNNDLKTSLIAEPVDLLPNANKDDSSNKLKCSECFRKFLNIFSLKTHMRKYHKTFGRQTMHCYADDCNFLCSKLNQYITHLNDKHDMNINSELLWFSGEKDFSDWMIKIERETPCNFLKDKETTNSEALKTSYFYCSRSGKYRTNPFDVKKRQAKAQGTCKIHDTCPAHFIKYVKSDDGSITVRYVSKHLCFSNRFQQLGHIRLSKNDKMWVVGRLAEGVSVSKILAEARLSSVNNVITDRRHLLTVQDIHNIARANKIEFKNKRTPAKKSKESLLKSLNEPHPDLDTLMNAYRNPMLYSNSLVSQIIKESAILFYKRLNDNNFDMIDDQLAMSPIVKMCQDADFLLLAFIVKPSENDYSLQWSDTFCYIYVDHSQNAITANGNAGGCVGDKNFKFNIRNLYNNNNDGLTSVNNNISSSCGGNFHNVFTSTTPFATFTNTTTNFNNAATSNVINEPISESVYYITSLAASKHGDQFFPFAFMVSNKSDDNIFTLFLQSINISLGSLKCYNLVGNSKSDHLYQSWVEVFGNEPRHLFCPVLLDQEWKSSIKKFIKDYKNVGIGVNQRLRRLLGGYENENYDCSLIGIFDFYASLDQLISELKSNKDTMEFANYFQKNFQQSFQKWAKYSYKLSVPSHANGSTINFCQIRNLLNSFLSQKKMTIDDIVWSILTAIHSYKYDHLLAICKGKTKKLHPDIEHLHNESTTLDPTSILLTAQDGRWFVRSEDPNFHFYEIKKQPEKCQCDLKCRRCQICVHTFTCSCHSHIPNPDDNDVRRMCKHIHLLCSQTDIPVDKNRSKEQLRVKYSKNEAENELINSVKKEKFSDEENSYLSICRSLEDLKRVCNGCHNGEILKIINHAIESMIPVAKNCTDIYNRAPIISEKDQNSQQNTGPDLLKAVCMEQNIDAKGGANANADVSNRLSYNTLSAGISDFDYISNNNNNNYNFNNSNNYCLATLCHGSNSYNYKNASDNNNNINNNNINNNNNNGIGKESVNNNNNNNDNNNNNNSNKNSSVNNNFEHDIYTLFNYPKNIKFSNTATTVTTTATGIPNFIDLTAADTFSSCTNTAIVTVNTTRTNTTTTTATATTTAAVATTITSATTITDNYAESCNRYVMGIKVNNNNNNNINNNYHNSDISYKNNSSNNNDNSISYGNINSNDNNNDHYSTANALNLFFLQQQQLNRQQLSHFSGNNNDNNNGNANDNTNQHRHSIFGGVAAANATFFPPTPQIIFLCSANNVLPLVQFSNSPCNNFNNNNGNIINTDGVVAGNGFGFGLVSPR